MRVPRLLAMKMLDAASSVDPLVGLRAAEHVTAEDLDVVEYAARHETTIEKAFQCLARYFAVLDEGQEATVSRDEGSVVVSLRPGAGLWQVSAANDFTLGILVGFCQRIASSWRPIRELQLAHERPEYASQYSRVFSAPVKYGCGHNAIVVSAECASMATRRPSETLSRMFESQAAFALRSLRGKNTFSTQVVRLIRECLRDESVDMRAVAQAQGMSVATLRRRLGHEATSFSRLDDQCRMAEALSLLRASTIPIRDVAYRVGYADASSFDRAFHRWSGMSPSTYRASEGWPPHGGDSPCDE